MKRSHSQASFLFGLAVCIFLLCQSCSEHTSQTDFQPEKKYQYLTGITYEKPVTKTELLNQLESYFNSVQIPVNVLAAFIQDIELAAIRYNTTGVDGKPIEASGLVLIPSGITAYDHLVSIQHVTTDIGKAPSETGFTFEMAPVLFGHPVAMADYLGYGITQTADMQHPYLHPETTGTACADMIEAAIEYLDYKQITPKADVLDLVGYSQGGTSTVATLLELEKRGKSASIREVHAGGGVYDLEGTIHYFRALGAQPYAQPGFIPYLFRGIMYGDGLELDAHQLYHPRIFENGLDALFGTSPLSKWHSALGRDLTQIVHPDFYKTADARNNPDLDALLQAFRKNSLLNGRAPQTPLLLYHTRADEYVPFLNVEAAVQTWSNAQLIELKASDHTLGCIEFMLCYLNLRPLFSGLFK